VAGRKAWHKIPSQLAKSALALDADSGDIIAHVMTDQDVGDASQVETLLEQIDTPIGQFTAHGAYDGNPIYDAIARHRVDVTVVILPRASAVERPDADPSTQRSRHVAAINADGRMKW
jgi:hypothetical protein